MSTFKIIGNLGIDLLYAYQCDRKATVIYAEDLEALLQSAQVVYGSPDTPSDQLVWSNTQLDCDTHKDFLLAVEPIKKKTKAEAALELLSEITNDRFHLPNNADIVQQAKRILEMKDEV